MIKILIKHRMKVIFKKNMYAGKFLSYAEQKSADMIGEFISLKTCEEKRNKILELESLKCVVMSIAPSIPVLYYDFDKMFLKTLLCKLINETFCKDKVTRVELEKSEINSKNMKTKVMINVLEMVLNDIDKIDKIVVSKNDLERKNRND